MGTTYTKASRMVKTARLPDLLRVGTIGGSFMRWKPPDHRGARIFSTATRPSRPPARTTCAATSRSASRALLTCRASAAGGHGSSAWGALRCAAGAAGAEALPPLTRTSPAAPGRKRRCCSTRSPRFPRTCSTSWWSLCPEVGRGLLCEDLQRLTRACTSDTHPPGPLRAFSGARVPSSSPATSPWSPRQRARPGWGSTSSTPAASSAWPGAASRCFPYQVEARTCWPLPP